jgi:putative MATE family efflux protein
MTDGPITTHLIAFSVPLLLGNIFQMLYNTVDSIVVGNFVGKEALAAISSTTMIVNIMIFFFNGFSVGGSVVIGQYLGARKMKELHRTVETTIAVTILFGIFFTFAGFFLVPFMLRLMQTPEDVFPQAKLYLEIYFSGALGLLIYNMGSGILRAVGDTKRPLYFLIFTSILNTVLDLVFVIVFKAGIAGAAIATIISQFISAIMVLVLLTRADDIYKLTWNDLRIDLPILKFIMQIGLPAGVQSMITSVSNVFVQSYINGFGSGCMAGWGAYNKLDSFIFLPINSLGQAATTFVSQNYGAGRRDRVRKGSFFSIACVVLMIEAIGVVMFLLAPQLVGAFSSDPSVIAYGVGRARVCCLFYCVLGSSHISSAVLRGIDKPVVPTVIMMVCWRALRVASVLTIGQIWHHVELSYWLYPVTWALSTVLFIVILTKELRKKT